MFNKSGATGPIRTCAGGYGAPGAGPWGRRGQKGAGVPGPVPKRSLFASRDRRPDRNPRMSKSAILALAVVLPSAGALAQPAAAPSGRDAPARTHQVYDVIRKGDKIGTDMLDIERQGDTTTIRMATTISVKLLFVEVYHYQHQATEIWKGGQLVSFRSQTNDNGTKHAVTAAAMPQKVSLDVDGVHADLPKSAVPATLWSSAELPKHSAIFDPADGKLMNVTVSDLGEETVTVHGVPRKAHHLKIGGDFPRDLWFDGDTLVRMQLTGSDSSVVTSDLQASADR